ncbi:hypothetical protein E8E11_011259 [Didymella keratinophila]|nr:hypothetical protein E8E11_011259 [Didymella keratinophila]
MSAVQDMLAPLPEISPEKLTILKAKHSTLNRDVFSEPSSPINEHRGMDFSNHHNNMSSVITRRWSSRAASGARRRSSFLLSHRSEMSEKPHVRLRARVVGSHISERESLFKEKEELLSRVDEMTEMIERVQSEHPQHNHERLRKLQGIYLKLKAVEDDRHHAKDEAHKHHGELCNLLREYTDLKNRYDDSHSKFERSRQEVFSLTDRIKIFELERDKHLHDKNRLQQDFKRAKHRAEESSRELYELTERHERTQRDITKLRESVRIAEEEHDEHHLTIENLRREVKAKVTGWEESDERLADVMLKYEHLKRKVISVKEKLREVETREIDASEFFDRSREDHHLIIIERDQVKEDLHDHRTRDAERHRQINVLEESLRRAEETIASIKAEIHKLTERNKVLIREGDDGRTKHGHLHNEIIELKEKPLIFQADIRTLTDETVETITESHDDSAELEFEIQSLRTLLREAREQKERTISARHTADHERDEYISKYEDKCRELERFEESASAHYHAHSESKGGSRSFTRTVSSGTTLHHNKHSHGDDGHGHSHSHGGGMFSP